MSARRLLLVTLVAVLLLGVVTPSVGAEHCRTKIYAYGRVSTAPMASPPYTSTTAGVCASLYGRGVDDHVLAPETDQVMVQIRGDFGPSVPKLLIELDGVGFADHLYYANRTLSPIGGYYYTLANWIALPAGPQSGDLVVTAYYPGNVTMSETYSVLELPAP